MNRYPLAGLRRGPLEKQGYPGLAVNACRGVILHSMVGSLAGALARLDSPDRASWHYSVTKTGRVLCHYDDEAVTWHAGVKQINGIFLGIEHEGGAPGNESEPLTPIQLAASVSLVRWLAGVHHFPLDRRPGWGLHEHNEYDATACPSGRIPFDAYMEGEDQMALTLAACGDSPTGYRLYALGGAAPVWVLDAGAANELIAVFGQPKGLSWRALVALGAK
jgi:hypothetical protein